MIMRIQRIYNDWSLTDLAMIVRFVEASAKVSLKESSSSLEITGEIENFY